MNDPIYELIFKEFELRKRQWPTTLEALGWLTHELGEAFDSYFSVDPKWIRNNPEDHPAIKERLADELGDVIYMALVTGIVSNCDPLRALMTKITRKINEAQKQE